MTAPLSGQPVVPSLSGTPEPTQGPTREQIEAMIAAGRDPLPMARTYMSTSTAPNDPSSPVGTPCAGDGPATEGLPVEKNWFAKIATDALIEQGRWWADEAAARRLNDTAAVLRAMADRLEALYYADPNTPPDTATVAPNVRRSSPSDRPETVRTSEAL